MSMRLWVVVVCVLCVRAYLYGRSRGRGASGVARCAWGCARFALHPNLAALPSTLIWQRALHPNLAHLSFGTSQWLRTCRTQLTGL
jgi:hypothetical protein